MNDVSKNTMKIPDCYMKFASEMNKDHVKRESQTHKRVEFMIKDLGHAFARELNSNALYQYATTLLKTHTVEQIESACERLKKTAKRLPTISDIVEAAPPKKTLKSNVSASLNQCSKCRDSGVLYVREQQSGLDYEYTYRCHCESGKNFPSYPLYKDAIPF